MSRFLLVMADVPGNEAKPLSAIAKGLGRSVNSLSMLRRSLIRKGVLYSSAEGTVSYTVPLFGEYLKRHSCGSEGEADMTALSSGTCKLRRLI